MEQVQEIQREAPPEVEDICKYSNSILQRLDKTLSLRSFHVISGAITIKEALLYYDWIITMQEELAEFKRNKVWKFVPKPKGHNTLELTGFLQEVGRYFFL